MKGTLVNRILSRAVKVAGSLAVVGSVAVAAAMPAAAAPPTRAWGVSAVGLTTIAPVALATLTFTPATSSAFVVPLFITTGGILDRASTTDAFSNVGSPKIYLGSQYSQLNASNVMSSCRNIFGFKFGQTTIQAGLDLGDRPAEHSVAAQPCPEHDDLPPGRVHGHAEQADGSGGHPHGDRDLRHQLPADPVGRGQPLLIAVTR